MLPAIPNLARLLADAELRTLLDNEHANKRTQNAAEDLKDRGASIQQLRDLGFDDDTLINISSLEELHVAGFGAAELIAAGISPKQIKRLYPIEEIYAAGITEAEMEGDDTQDLQNLLDI
jgi:hypothetical protein